MTGDNGIVKRMQIGGIVRSTSAMNNADGNCEEIINLRQDTGVWRVVGRKEVKVEDVSYEQVFLHQYSDFQNYLGVKKWSETEKDETGMPVVKTRRAVVWFDPDTKEEKQEICRVEGEATLEQMNNILLVKDSINIVKAVFSAAGYDIVTTALPESKCVNVREFKKDLPKSNIVNFKLTDISYDPDVPGKPCGENHDTNDFLNNSSDTDKTRGGISFDQIELEEMMSSLVGLYRKTVNRDKEFRQGYIFISTAFELFDGTVTKPTAPKLYRLGAQYDPDIIHCHQNNFDDGTSILKLKFSILPTRVTQLKLSAPEFSESEIDKYKDIIKKINVYASEVIDIYDTENANAAYLHFTLKSGERYNLIHSEDKTEGFPEKRLDTNTVDNQLFYRVAQFDFVRSSNDEIAIDFSKITTNPTLPVDASGWLNTSGNMFVYNNRLHLYNVRQKFLKSDKMFSVHFLTDFSKKSLQPVEASYIIYLKNASGGSAKFVMKDNVYCKIEAGEVQLYAPSFIAFADSRAYKAEVIFSCNNKKYKALFSLTASQSYNYAFYIRHSETTTDNIVICKETTEVEGEDSDLLTDNTKILVSEIANPYFFPPEHSYSLPGEILNLAVNTQQISASQIGQFPLYAFTTEGIYALQQGEGKVLYSNVIPVSAEIAVKGSSVLQTKYGIVFVTADGLKLISGSEVVDLSEAVKGRIDEYFMKQRSYSMILEDSWLWNASPFISRIPFEEYIQKAVMGYDIVKDEIIVSNPAYRYSYVYSLKTKTWHKITEVFSSFSRHLALKQNWPSGQDVCDIREEVKGIRPVFMLTRPINLGNFGYNMVYHYCMRGEIRPLKEEERCNSLSVFLSNDLQYWEFGPQANPIIDMPVVPLDRLLCASRYFRLLYTGEVEPEHTLALVEMDGEEKFDNKIR